MADPKRSTTYKKAREQLQKCDAKPFLTALDLGLFQPYSDGIVEAFAAKYYGKHRYDGPTKLDTSKIPWPRLPTIPETQKMLRAVMKQTDYSTMPTTGSSEQDQRAAEELLINLGNTNFKGAYAVMGLDCTALGDRRKSASTGWPATLAESDLLCDIMPAGGVGELNMNDCHELCVLVSGVRVWFQFPPTDHNLTVYAKLLKSRSKKTHKPIDADDLSNLRGGVVLLQEKGETVEIAPFCPTIMISTEPSVSANWMIDIAEKVPARLKNLHLFSIENSGLRGNEKKQAIRQTLLARQRGLLPSVQAVLEGNIQHLDEQVVKNELARAWESGKDALNGLLVASGDGTWTPEKIATMWVESMMGPTTRREQSCSICNQRFNWNRHPRDEMKRRLQKHFLEEHWPAQKPAKAKRKSEVESLKIGQPTPTKRSRKK
ncbi:hypothetical protein K491DRAFT_684361 [Lophiostoma macrostomum CBS 122681]|uniref:Uncharacterized protein n=1 Tax=Lophiostoma macrostomum CBS 122681 TaxID=1314788 RepID=A0A6A6SR23_9PLEO|nr:hypothetical protein K491DRAFT_684361 [Lophiostoma macrostomum CBS 122681]